MDSPASHPTVCVGFECPRHLTFSSKNSTLLHRTAGRCFSGMHNWALAGAKMTFPCLRMLLFELSSPLLFIISIDKKGKRKKLGNFVLKMCYSPPPLNDLHVLLSANPGMPNAWYF